MVHLRPVKPGLLQEAREQLPTLLELTLVYFRLGQLLRGRPGWC
jgi:hypothetical protein